MIFSIVLEWLILIIQWFFDVKDVLDKNYMIYCLFLGIYIVEGKLNYFQIVDVEVLKLVKFSVCDYDEDCGEIGGYGNLGGFGELYVIKMMIM